MTILGSGIAWSQDDQSLEDQLNLSQQQKQQVTNLRNTFKQEAAPIKDRIRKLQGERKKLQDDGAPQEEIKQVLEKIADEEISLALLLNKFKKDYVKVLTAEQRAKLQELKSNR